MLEQQASSSEFWVNLPWGWLATCFVAFLVGQIVQDIFNSNSWIRRNIADIRKLFIIQNVNIFSENKDGFEWFEVRVKLKFIRNTKAARIIFEVEQSVNVPHARKKFVLFSKNAQTLDQNKEQSFTIAIIPDKSPEGEALGYQCWGNRLRKSGDIDGIRSLSDGTESFLKITIKSGFFFQEERIFIAVPNQNWHHAGRVWLTHSQSEYLEIFPKGDVDVKK